jgi:hypothetical protein
MRVTDMFGNDTEAIGPALWSGRGEVFLVRGEWVDYLHFLKLFLPAKERRQNHRRQYMGRRWRDTGELPTEGRRDSRRTFARRMRDRLTERELFQLAQGIEHVEISRKEMA